MAFETGTATDLDDLMTKLNTFAVANGWTSEDLDLPNGEHTLSKGGIFVSWRWDTATPNTVAMYQSTGFTGGNRNGTHPGDSGNGFNTSTSTTEISLLGERCVHILGDGPYPSYHFFEKDSGPAYLHVVVERSQDIFRHFGMGEIDKFGDWAGGEYVYGQVQLVSSLASPNNVAMFDGFTSNVNALEENRTPTMRISSFPGQPGGSIYGQIWGSRTAAIQNDTAGNAKIRIMGGFKAGPIARHFGWYKATATAGLIPMYQFGIFQHEDATSKVRYLGSMPDVRGVNIGSFAAKQEVTIGSDTWVMFPTAFKTQTAVNDRTYNQGIAYKKVTA